jgi:hypothetical protein
MIMAWYLLPAVRKAGPDGPKMMAAITSTNSFPLVVSLSGIISVVSGCLLLYYHYDTSGSAWLGTPMGICFSTGGTLAIVALIIGLSVNKPTVGKIQKMSAAIAQSGNPPTDEQRAQLMQWQQRVFSASQILAGLIAICVLLMGIARYAHVFSAE